MSDKLTYCSLAEEKFKVIFFILTNNHLYICVNEKQISLKKNLNFGKFNHAEIHNRSIIHAYGD